MKDFSMTKYWHQYQEKSIKLDRLKSCIENKKAALVYAENVEAALREIEGAEKEYLALETEVRDLWCKARTGRGAVDVSRTNTIQWQNQVGGQKPH